MTALRILVVAVLVTLYPMSGWAEHADSPAGFCGTSGFCATDGKGHTTAPGGIKDTHAKLLSDLFSVPESFVRSRFGDTLSPAIEDSISGNETKMSGVLGELFNYVNKAQVEEIVAKVKPIHDAAAGKSKEDGRDDREVTLLNRILRATGVIKGGDAIDDKPEAKAFNKEFGQAFDAHQAKGKEVLAQIANAPTNAKAKEYLRANINREAFAAFTEGQLNKGNTKLATDLARALAWQTDRGHNFLDFWGPGGESRRLIMGKSDADISAALTAMSKDKGLAGNLLVEKRHSTKPQKEWYVENGKLVPGRPGDFSLPEDATAVPAQAAAAAGAAGAVGAAAVGASGAPGAGPAAVGAIAGPGNAATDTLTLIKGLGSRCLSCHENSSFEGNSLKDLVFKKGGSPRRAAAIEMAVNTEAKMKQFRDDPAFMRLLAEWKKAQ